jgi:hypothetical protein
MLLEPLEASLKRIGGVRRNVTRSTCLPKSTKADSFEESRYLAKTKSSGLRLDESQKRGFLLSSDVQSFRAKSLLHTQSDLVQELCLTSNIVAKGSTARPEVPPPGANGDRPQLAGKLLHSRCQTPERASRDAKSGFTASQREDALTPPNQGKHNSAETVVKLRFSAGAGERLPCPSRFSRAEVRAFNSE